MGIRTQFAQETGMSNAERQLRDTAEKVWDAQARNLPRLQ